MTAALVLGALSHLAQFVDERAKPLVARFVRRGVARDLRQIVPLVDDDDRVLDDLLEPTRAADDGIDELLVRDEDERRARLGFELARCFGLGFKRARPRGLSLEAR